MQPEARGKYAFYLFVILAGLLMSVLLLSGPLKDAGKDLARPMLDEGTEGTSGTEHPSQIAMLYVIVSFVLTLYGAHLAARFLSDRTWRRRDLYMREIRWSILDSSMVIVLFVGLPILAASLVSGSSGIAENGSEISAERVLAAALSQFIVLLFAIGVLKQRGDSFGNGMGLTIRPWGRLIIIGVVAFLAFQPLHLIYTTGVVALFYNLSLPIEAHPVVDELLKPVGMDVRLVLILSVALFAPFFEEVFFRGFLYQAIRKRVEAWAAIVFTAALFASVHPSLFQASLIFPLGLLLAYLMEKTGSIIPGITVHFLVNGTSSVRTFLMSG